MNAANKKAPGFIVLFGSGEMSPTGGTIHEQVLKLCGIRPPARIGILETPTGFEVNALHAWPERMAEFFSKRLHNYKPVITRVHAWKKSADPLGTNNPANAEKLSGLDYLYCGAGSPSYTVRHLGGSRVYRAMIQALRSGTTLCLGSASAVAVGTYAIPVYEIYKSGEDLHWISGLNLFSLFGIDNVVIVPHWNNQEGEDFDTTCCWMGKERFNTLATQLPKETTIIGIDEQTACIIDIERKTALVAGVGTVVVRRSKNEQTYRSGDTFSLVIR